VLFSSPNQIPSHARGRLYSKLWWRQGLDPPRCIIQCPFFSSTWGFLREHQSAQKPKPNKSRIVRQGLPYISHALSHHRHRKVPSVICYFRLVDRDQRELIIFLGFGVDGSFLGAAESCLRWGETLKLEAKTEHQKSTSWPSYIQHQLLCRRRIDLTRCRLALLQPSGGAWKTTTAEEGIMKRRIRLRIKDSRRIKHKLVASQARPQTAFDRRLWQPPHPPAEDPRAQRHTRGITKNQQLPFRRVYHRIRSSTNPATHKTNGSSKILPIITRI
jgi:hypothetical protein